MAIYDEQDPDEVEVYHAPKWLTAVAVLALVVAVASLLWSLMLQSHLSSAETSLAAANQQNSALAQKLDDTNARLRAQGQALGQSMGMTQKELEDKSDELIAEQKTTLAETAKLQREQKATEQKVGAVQSDVSSVKSDVGGVKTDVAATQADLADTKTQLTRVIGDAGVMSGLIATNHDQLEELKRKGERNYYEFTLQKGAPAKNVGTIKVELKKVDPKRSKYSLMVSADDKNIEKKDKTLDEPIQFYSGKTPALFEIVVNNVTKNQVTGYLSTPKSAPEPIAVP
jgi:chromosome segregation ATPase